MISKRQIAAARNAEERTQDALNDPHLLDEIVVTVASGGSLSAFCADHKLMFKGVLAWILANSEREERYNDALNIREQHAKDEIIKELYAYLRADVTDAFDADGSLIPINDWPSELQRMVAGVEYQELFETEGEGRNRQRVHVGRIHKIKFWDKPRSIELFMRNLKMLIDRHEVTGKVSLADLVNDVKSPDA